MSTEDLKFDSERGYCRFTDTTRPKGASVEDMKVKIKRKFTEMEGVDDFNLDEAYEGDEGDGGDGGDEGDGGDGGDEADEADEADEDVYQGGHKSGKGTLNHKHSAKVSTGTGNDKREERRKSRANARVNEIIWKIQTEFQKEFMFFHGESVYQDSITSDTIWHEPHILLPLRVGWDADDKLEAIQRVASEHAGEARVVLISNIWRDSMEHGLTRANLAITNSKWLDAMSELLSMHWFMCNYSARHVGYFANVACVSVWYEKWTDTWITLLRQSDEALGLHTPNAPVDGQACRATLIKQLNLGSLDFHKRKILNGKETNEKEM